MCFIFVGAEAREKKSSANGNNIEAERQKKKEFKSKAVICKHAMGETYHILNGKKTEFLCWMMMMMIWKEE